MGGVLRRSVAGAWRVRRREEAQLEAGGGGEIRSREAAHLRHRPEGQGGRARPGTVRSARVPGPAEVGGELREDGQGANDEERHRLEGVLREGAAGALPLRHQRRGHVARERGALQQGHREVGHRLEGPRGSRGLAGAWGLRHGLLHEPHKRVAHLQVRALAVQPAAAAAAAAAAAKAKAAAAAAAEGWQRPRDPHGRRGGARLGPTQEPRPRRVQRPGGGQGHGLQRRAEDGLREGFQERRGVAHLRARLRARPGALRPPEHAREGQRRALSHGIHSPGTREGTPRQVQLLLPAAAAAAGRLEVTTTDTAVKRMVRRTQTAGGGVWNRKADIRAGKAARGKSLLLCGCTLHGSWSW
jgi:hypothetical protein